MKADDYLKGLSKKEFVEKIGYYYSELNAIHPFREGNGRTNRIFIDLLAKKNNLNLNIEKWKEKEQISAMIDAMSGNTKKLLKMINKYII